MSDYRELIDAIRELTDRIDKLIDAKEPEPEEPWKPSPRLPDFPLPIPEPTAARCSRCGMNFSGVMGYVCARSGCPMGSGSIICESKT